MRAPVPRRRGLRTRASILLCIAAALGLLGVGAAVAAVSNAGPFGTHRVGQQVDGATLLADNEWVSPVGLRILDRKARLLSSTLSPNGQDVAALGWNNFQGYLTIINVRSHKIIQQTALATPTTKPTDNTVGTDGPLYSSDGTTLWVPQSQYLLRYSVNPTTGQATQTAAIELCGESSPTNAACEGNSEAEQAKGAELPAGMALSPDGSELYVALNGANKLAVIDTATNTVTSEIPVGNAPRQIVLTNNGATAYVSNEGGYPARPGQYTNLSDGTPMVADHTTGAASTGTVSVVDLQTGRETQEIRVGLQPTEMYRHGNALMVANSNDDSLSVIDTATNHVTQTVNTNPVPDVTKVGSYADAITMLGDHVLVAIGRDNAIAEYTYHGLSRKMTYVGLIPTDWYPVQIQPDPALGADTLVVTNDKGIGARGPKSTIDKDFYTKVAKGHNTYDDTGSLTLFPLPSATGLKRDTHRVFVDNAWTQIPVVKQGTADTVPTVIPRHLGGASPIKHVVVIVKENRTYDQVFGDLGEGDGDPALAQFGKYVTPNMHALAHRFGDLDNFYDEGTLSADGHNWIVQAEANDYNEREFGAFYRSYPAQGGDALAYQRDGFLWNTVERAHKSVEDFGEYAAYPTAQPGSWDDYYKDSEILQGKARGKLPISPGKYKTTSDIPSLNKIIDHAYPKFQLNIPDQYRVDMWNRYFDRWQRSRKMPNLQMMWVMDDHTAGVGSGEPYPVAEAADNDLAVGRIISEISHSRFWKSTAVFVVEDDTQNGVDSVDGHRGPVIVASPYSAPGVDAHYYSQINMVRTIEQILGAKPMNQEDSSASPMYAAFTGTPDDAPYDLHKNIVPLTLGAPGYSSKLSSGPLKGTGEIPKSARGLYRAWVAWSREQKANGRASRADAMNPAQLNRLDWYSAHGWTVAYPGDKQIYYPNQVPGRKLPAAFIGDD